MCHNPHENVKPADALKSCATAGCHADWEKVEFHTGKIHRQAVENCETCHTPHAARVDASDCAGCHERVRGSVTGGSGPEASIALRHHQGAPVGVGAARPDRPPREGRRAAG